MCFLVYLSKIKTNTTLTNIVLYVLFQYNMDLHGKQMQILQKQLLTILSCSTSIFQKEKGATKTKHCPTTGGSGDTGLRTHALYVTCLFTLPRLLHQQLEAADTPSLDGCSDECSSLQQPLGRTSGSHEECAHTHTHT